MWRKERRWPACAACGIRHGAGKVIDSLTHWIRLPAQATCLDRGANPQFGQLLGTETFFSSTGVFARLSLFAANCSLTRWGHEADEAQSQAQKEEKATLASICYLLLVLCYNFMATTRRWFPWPEVMTPTASLRSLACSFASNLSVPGQWRYIVVSSEGVFILITNL